MSKFKIIEESRFLSLDEHEKTQGGSCGINSTYQCVGLYMNCSPTTIGKTTCASAPAHYTVTVCAAYFNCGIHTLYSEDEGTCGILSNHGWT